MVTLTMVDSGCHVLGYYGKETEVRAYDDRWTAMAYGYLWYAKVYEDLSKEFTPDDDLMGKVEFMNELTDNGSYVTIKFPDFHVQFEYMETEVVTGPKDVEDDKKKFYDVYFQFKPLVKAVEAKSREEAEQIAKGWDDTSLPKDELLERFLAAVADTDSIRVCDVIEAPVVGNSLKPIL